MIAFLLLPPRLPPSKDPRPLCLFARPSSYLFACLLCHVSPQPSTHTHSFAWGAAGEEREQTRQEAGWNRAGATVENTAGVWIG
jgi:hypothetical protein